MFVLIPDYVWCPKHVPMFRSFFKDWKLILLVVLQLCLVALMVLIWQHYDRELQRIDNQMNESKVRSGTIEIHGDR
jgi:type II secretory pathway component PulM